MSRRKTIQEADPKPREMRELVVNNIKMTIINIFYVINKIEKNISMTT